MEKLLLFIGLIFLMTPLMSQTGTVIFKVSNIKAEKGGEISAGIFTKENFPKVGKQLKGTEEKVTGEYMEITLTEVPPGIYGAVAFQDIDENKDLKTNLIGFPKEPIGFANGAKINLGPPSFKSASIEVKEGQTTIITIQLK